MSPILLLCSCVQVRLLPVPCPIRLELASCTFLPVSRLQHRFSLHQFRPVIPFSTKITNPSATSIRKQVSTGGSVHCLLLLLFFFLLIPVVVSLPVSCPPNVEINVERAFLEACIGVSQSPPGPLAPSWASDDSVGSPTATLFSSADTLLSPTSAGFATIHKPGIEGVKRLTDFYANAYTDFFGSNTPCIYKTGPSWPIAVGPESQKIIRAARPVYYDHPFAPIWLETAWSIVAKLDNLQVNWNTVNPLAYANAGEAALICDFVITIGVEPESLAFNDAVAAANVVDEILQVRVTFFSFSLILNQSDANFFLLRSRLQASPRFRLHSSSPFTVAMVLVPSSRASIPCSTRREFLCCKNPSRPLSVSQLRHSSHLTLRARAVCSSVSALTRQTSVSWP